MILNLSRQETWLTGRKNPENLTSSSAIGAIFNSKAGADTMTGTAGIDSFILDFEDENNNFHRDVVKSFTDGVDKIRVDVNTPSSVTDSNYLSKFGISVTQGTGAESNHTIIRDTSSNSVVMVLEDITATDITFTDFEII